MAIKVKSLHEVVPGYQSVAPTWTSLKS